jgi:hypothetical protein
LTISGWFHVLLPGVRLTVNVKRSWKFVATGVNVCFRLAVSRITAEPPEAPRSGPWLSPAVPLQDQPSGRPDVHCAKSPLAIRF